MKEDTIEINGRQVALDVTPGAEVALVTARAPLHIDMELYFSCLIGKRVNFVETPPEHTVGRARLTDRVTVGFRAYATETCQAGDQRHALESKIIPLDRAERYMPKWLKIDYRDGAWSGEFGL
jgi:hypothetical protein